MRKLNKRGVTMYSLSRLCLLLVLSICTMAISGCSFLWTTQNGNPYTPEETIEIINDTFKSFHPQVIVKSVKTEKDKPFQENIYELYDEHYQIAFTINSYVSLPTLPVPGGQRNTNAEHRYAEAYSQYVNEQMIPTAAKLGMHVADDKEKEILYQSKRTRTVGNDNKITLFSDNHFIFVNDTTRGKDIVALLKECYHLYAPNQDKAMLNTLIGRDIGIFYLPQGETDITKAAYIDTFRIGYPGVDVDWLSTLRENQSPHITNATQRERDLTDRYDTAIANLHN